MLDVRISNLESKSEGQGYGKREEESVGEEGSNK